MIEVKEAPTDLALLDRAGGGDAAAAEDLYDRYGAALYALAITVTKRPSAAEAAVVHGFLTAAASASAPGDRAWHLLARATLAACPEAHGGRETCRCLLALTLFGAHDYREAAATLDVAPEVAARCLREVLRSPDRPPLPRD